MDDGLFQDLTRELLSFFRSLRILGIGSNSSQVLGVGVQTQESIEEGGPRPRQVAALCSAHLALFVAYIVRTTTSIANGHVRHTGGVEEFQDTGCDDGCGDRRSACLL